ncbi:MAG: SCP2 sterol-binding domain-containing protein [Sandaracinaceae bacterium]|nr:SCP2 sterol-binding domain-containing protein [Sandaracinaceae bacterium]
MTGMVRDTREYFDTLDERFVPHEARGVSATLQYELSGETGGQWFVRVRGGQLIEISQGMAERPTLTLRMDARKFVDMTNGELDGTLAYMVRDLRVQGNVALAGRMKQFLPPRTTH